MFEKITEHIYCRPYQHYTDRPNIGWIDGNKYSLLFDAGNSEANVKLLREELKQAGLKNPDFVALSHWHWDHTFGAAFWNVPIIAGRRTNEQLKKMMLWQWDDKAMQDRIDSREDIVFCSEMIKREYPDRDQIRVVSADLVFEGNMILDLGGVEVHLIHAEGPHSDDSVICYVPEERFVFLSDSNGKDLYGLQWHFDIEHEEDFVPVTGALPYDMEKVKAYLRILDTLDFTHCISGHGDLMTREEFYKSYK